MALRTRILLIEGDTALRRSVQRLLEDDGYEVALASSAAEGLERLDRDQQFAAVISDVLEGVDRAPLLERLRVNRPTLPIVGITGGEHARPLEALTPGSMRPPPDLEELRHRVRRATADEHLPAGTAPAAGPDDAVDVLVGDSRSMVALRETISRVAAVDSTVLIHGETGTGKDLVARLIHRASPRRDRPMLTINCGAPDELLLAEVFGQERTPAPGGGAHHGRLERADGGTVFLDEIGDLPLSLQPRILRFLRDHALPRPGGLRERILNVRVIAATQRNIPNAIAAGDFRSDLFFRLAAVPIELPPLRAHIEDLPALCRHLVAKLALRLGMPAVELADSATEALSHHRFPGNVRELENVLERALVLGPGTEGPHRLEITELPEYGAASQPPSSTNVPLEGGFARLRELQTGMERDLIQRAMRRWPDLSNTQIAQRLGTNRRILELRMKEYGLAKRSRSDPPRI